MILLVTSAGRAGECVSALQEALNHEVVIAENLARAITLLRTESYLLLVLDQHLLESANDVSENLFDHVGTAVVVQVNLAISGVDRLIREVRAAIQRRQREEASARQAAIGRLHGQLNGTITALLLSTELALVTPGLPLAAADKLASVHELVKNLRLQIETAEVAEEAAQVVNR
jgi:hypothetical protein